MSDSVFSTLSTTCPFESLFSLLDLTTKPSVNGEFIRKTGELLAHRRAASDMQQIGNVSLT